MWWQRVPERTESFRGRFVRRVDFGPGIGRRGDVRAL